MSDELSTNPFEQSDGAREAPEQSAYTRSSSAGFYMRSDEFCARTSRDEQQMLFGVLQKIVIGFIKHDVPVYLEGFGLLSPELRSEPVCSYYEGGRELRMETLRTVSFEKCNDFVSQFRDRVGAVAETRELSQLLAESLPPNHPAKSSTREARRLLRTLIVVLRDEVLATGRSRLLEEVGEFIALHNRQGATISEWFAGADVFLVPSLRAPISSGMPRKIEMPVLVSPWEPLEAAYGKPIEIRAVNLARELSRLGYELHELPPYFESSLQLAVFKGGDDQSADGEFLLCTDGFRRLRPAEGAELGPASEIVMRFTNRARSVFHDDELYPPAPDTMLALAWLLMESSRSKSLKFGAGLSSGEPLFAGSTLSTVLVSDFASLPGWQPLGDGGFVYRALLAVTDDEANLAQACGAEFLLQLLARKKLHDRITPQRTSILNCSSFLMTQPRLPI